MRSAICAAKKVREKSRECHSHKPQPFPDPKRKRKPTNLNKPKPNKRTKITKISFLFPKRSNRNTKMTEKHKNTMTHEKTYNKSPRRINHKATRSKTNTKPATWKGAPGCECCPCTGTLIKNPLMMIDDKTKCRVQEP